MRGLVARAVVEDHAAHAAAAQDAAGSMGTFLYDAAFPDVRALNRAGALRLLSAMLRVSKTVRAGLVDPEAAPYGICREWQTPNWTSQPLLMGHALQLTGEGSAIPLRSTAPALLHLLRARHSADDAPYLNQARGTYPLGVSALEAALHLLRPKDEDLDPYRAIRDTTEGDAPLYTPSCATPSPGNPPGTRPSSRQPTC